MKYFLTILVTLFMTTPSVEADEGLKANVDHIIKTIPQADYEVILDYMNTNFKACLLDLGPALPQELKFIALTKEKGAYFELWNSAIYYQVGDQVAFKPKSKSQRQAFQKYYGKHGLDWGAAGFFTLGRFGAMGDARGGTFYADYAFEVDYEAYKDCNLNRLVGVHSTQMPEIMSVVEDYKNFGMREEEGRYLDENGFQIAISEFQFDPTLATSAGHTSITYELVVPGHERKEKALNDNVKIITEGSHLTIVFNKLFKP